MLDEHFFLIITMWVFMRKILCDPTLHILFYSNLENPKNVYLFLLFSSVYRTTDLRFEDYY